MNLQNLIILISISYTGLTTVLAKPSLLGIKSLINDEINIIQQKLKDMKASLQKTNAHVTTPKKDSIKEEKRTKIVEILSLVPDYVATNKEEAREKFNKLVSRMQAREGGETTTGGCEANWELKAQLSLRLIQMAKELMNSSSLCPAGSNSTNSNDEIQNTCVVPNSVYGCASCLHEVDLGPRYFPRYINVEKCVTENTPCVYGSGQCVQDYVHVPFLYDEYNVGNGNLQNWEQKPIAIAVGCRCKMFQNNIAEMILYSLCYGTDLCSHF